MATVEELSDFVREEQRSLWYTLSEAINRAVNGRWSMDASNVARRTVAAARLVGPSNHGEIPWPLVAGGVYEAVLRAGGITPDLPDEAEWRRLDALMAKHGGTLADHQARFADTVAAVQAKRETAWIDGADE